MEWPLVGMYQCDQGRCYNLVGRCFSQGSYFNFSSVLLTRTSSHMWGRWYLPMFLFRDGPLTLIYIDSLINLERFCSSLPTILKLFSVVVWPVMLLWSCIGEGAFRCSLNLSPNVLAVSLCIPHHIPTCHIYICKLHHFFGDVIFVFRCHKFFFDGFSTLKVNFYAISLACILKVSLSPSL